MSVASKPELEERIRESKRVKYETLLTLGFSEEDKIGIFQPHDDALVLTLCIGGYDVKWGWNYVLGLIEGIESQGQGFE